MKTAFIQDIQNWILDGYRDRREFWRMYLDENRMDLVRSLGGFASIANSKQKQQEYLNKIIKAGKK